MMGGEEGEEGDEEKVVRVGITSNTTFPTLFLG
jgi:hypothetical protein